MVFKRKKNIFKNVLFSFLFVILDITAKKLPDNTGRGGIIFKVKEGTWNVVSEKIKAEVNKVNPNAELMLSYMEEEYDK